MTIHLSDLFLAALLALVLGVLIGMSLGAVWRQGTAIEIPGPAIRRGVLKIPEGSPLPAMPAGIAADVAGEDLGMVARLQDAEMLRRRLLEEFPELVMEEELIHS